MIFNAVVLFVTTLGGGLLLYAVRTSGEFLKLPLVFAGSFLFSVTVIHILPEVFATSGTPMLMGMVVLSGFFFQQFLEIFTSGVEHGHFHKAQKYSGRAGWGLVAALVVHSVLEGALLNHHSPFHGPYDSPSLLMGIVFHKIPAAFALMAVMRRHEKPRVREMIILLVFSLSSPLGIWLSNHAVSLSSGSFLILFAFVSGSFLHISTTIFVETSPNHTPGFKRSMVSVGGALSAILAEQVG